GLKHNVQSSLQPRFTFIRIEENWQRLGLDSRLIDASELFHFGILQDRLRQSELSATLRVGIDEITFAAKRECRRGNEFFTNWINGWIGDLRKQLLEVVVKQLGFIGQNGQWRICTHRTHRLDGVLRHRPDVNAQIFKVVPESL